MAIVSAGYDGTVDEVQFAKMIPSVGSSQYGVAAAGDWKVSAHPSTAQAVNVAAGSGWGRGVFDASSSVVTVQCDPISSGTRWDLIVARRDWQPVNGSTVFAKVTGGSSKTIPTRLTNPGVQDEQPLALVQWTAGQTQPTSIVDLRCWAGNGGMVAKDALAKSYLNTVGAEVYIAGVVWRYALGTNDVASWVAASTSTTYAPLGVSGYSLTGTITVESVGSSSRVTVDINMKRTRETNDSIPSNVFQSFGAIIPSGARGNSGETKYLPVSISGGYNNNHATVALDTDTGVLSIRSLQTFSFTPLALFTLNATYYI